MAIDSLVERALPVIVSELDPHSVYIPASEMAEINEPLDGEFDGIGVVFNMATDTVIVLNVISSGPSDKAGVVAGDRIVRINDSLVAGQQIAQREIMRRLRGKRGSEVRLGLERRGIDELVEVTVVRDKIPIRSLTAALMLTGDIAFSQTGPVRPHLAHRTARSALDAPHAGNAQTDPRPAGQFRAGSSTRRSPSPTSSCPPTN